MTEIQQLQWIKKNLQAAMLNATRDNLYTIDWLAAIACRETGIMINHQTDIPDWTKFIGDNSHGYGPTQIDIRSFPDFVNSGDWKDPYMCMQQTVKVLQSNRSYLSNKTKLTGEYMDRAITAAYNCGMGRVAQVVRDKKDIDTYTANHNYSKEVFRLRELYKKIASP